MLPAAVHRIAPVVNVFSTVVMIFALTMTAPLIVAYIYNDAALLVYEAAIAITFLAGVIMRLTTRHQRRELLPRDGFLLVILVWTILPAFATLPLMLYIDGLSFTDAYFETVSGITTTGATTLTNLDQLPPSINFWRLELQWLGGMGIIVLAVAILRLLGIGGMQLYKAETPGPLKDAKMTPRITETAKALWYIYLSMTVACALLYWLAGMSLFDAITHSFSTIAIGGFSTHDQSIGFFDNRAIEAIAVIFMVLSGINFTLHFLAWQNTSLKPYTNDSEFKAYLTFLFSFSIVCCVYLIIKGNYPGVTPAISEGIFQAVSIATTTGFTTARYQVWPDFLPVLLLFSSFVGACAVSTGGGIKVVRVL